MFRKQLLRKAMLLGLLVVVSLDAQAIVMRHDRDEAQYLSSFNEWPSTAYFKIAGRFGNGTGTLVASRWVLTAGHVAYSLNTGDPVTINGRDYTISRIVSHPAYTLYGSKNDIGLVQLATPVSSITPARLYKQKNEAGKIITFVGAGRPGNGLVGAQGTPGIIRAATNQVEEARDQLLVFTFDAPPMALHEEGISGPGDSGGPAYLLKDGKTYVLGISAYQGESANGIEGVYGVREFYTRVSAHAAWINSTIGAKSKTLEEFPNPFKLL